MTPFAHLATIVVGAIVSAAGAALVYQVFMIRYEEIQRYGFAEAHVWLWIRALGIVVIGIFMAHAGVTFYFRKIRKAVSKLTQGS